MNIVGKILVVLNLLFALVTGGLLLLNYATSTNWKALAEQREQEIKAYDSRLKTWIQDYNLLANNVKTVKSQGEGYRGDNAKLIEEHKAAIALKNNEIDLLNIKIQELDVPLKQAEAALKRVTEETGILKGTILKRDEVILALNLSIDDANKRALQEKNRADTMEDRAKEAMESYRKVQQQLAKMQSAGEGTGTKTASVKDRNAANPPPRDVKGEIENVGEGGLVRINVGLDDGLSNGHTLEVFRLLPKGEYLGMIRIEDANHHTSIARMVPMPHLQPKGLQKGDRVVSSLRP